VLPLLHAETRAPSSVRALTWHDPPCATMAHWDHPRRGSCERKTLSHHPNSAACRRWMLERDANEFRFGRTLTHPAVSFFEPPGSLRSCSPWVTAALGCASMARALSTRRFPGPIMVCQNARSRALLQDYLSDPNLWSSIGIPSYFQRIRLHTLQQPMCQPRSGSQGESFLARRVDCLSSGWDRRDSVA
jgi:hypothetical protein